jgi:hypothetical protein
MKICILLALFILFANGITFIPVPDSQMIAADVVLRGRFVDETESPFEEPVTLFKFDIEEIFKGREVLDELPKRYYTHSMLHIHTIGGLDKRTNLTIYIPGSPVFHQAGEKFILFLTNDRGWLKIHHFHQGAFVKVSAPGHQSFALNRASDFVVRNGETFARDFDLFEKWIRETLLHKRSTIDYFAPWSERSEGINRKRWTLFLAPAQISVRY